MAPTSGWSPGASVAQGGSGYHGLGRSSQLWLQDAAVTSKTLPPNPRRKTEYQVSEACSDKDRHVLKGLLPRAGLCGYIVQRSGFYTGHQQGAGDRVGLIILHSSCSHGPVTFSKAFEYVEGAVGVGWDNLGHPGLRTTDPPPHGKA